MDAIDVRADCGAVGDGATDDTEAVRRAIAELPNSGSAGSSGGVVRFPPGSYVITAPIDVTGLFNTTLEGAGSQWGGTRLIATPAAAPAITGKPTSALRIRNLSVNVLDAAYKGPVLDLGVPSGSPSVSGLFGIESAHFYAPPGSPVTFIRLTNAVSGFVRDCLFQGGGDAIYGRQAASDYANVIAVEGCTFTGQAAPAPIRNLYSGCTVRGCSFEPLRNGNAGAVMCDPGLPMEGFLFEGNWLGDVNPATPFGRWVSVNGSGLCFVANMFDSGNTAVWLNGPASGVQITGNRFANLAVGFDRGGQPCANALIAGNDFVAVPSRLVGASGMPASLVM